MSSPHLQCSADLVNEWGFEFLFVTCLLVVVMVFVMLAIWTERSGSTVMCHLNTVDGRRCAAVRYPAVPYEGLYLIGS